MPSRKRSHKLQNILIYSIEQNKKWQKSKNIQKKPFRVSKRAFKYIKALDHYIAEYFAFTASVTSNASSA